MNEIQVSIIDDEKDGRDYIALLLANEFPSLKIIFQASNVKDAAFGLADKQPDILFLDIRLSDGTAFDLLSKITNLSSQIIFITAYEHYAIQAIKNGALDYILKPINRPEFIDAVNKAIANIHNNKSSQFGIKINLPTLHGFKRVDIAQIIRCEADSNYTFIYLTDGSKIVVSHTLRQFDEFLSKHQFLRVHHKHLINLAHFKEYIKDSGGQALMSDNSSVDISVRKRSQFLAAIEKL